MKRVEGLKGTFTFTEGDVHLHQVVYGEVGIQLLVKVNVPFSEGERPLQRNVPFARQSSSSAAGAGIA